MKIILFFIMVCLLIGGQILGAKFQIKSFNEALKRLHKKGNVGVGTKKRKVGPGYVVLLACDSQGTITGGELMRGITVFNSFKEYGKWNGQSIYDVNARLKAGNEEAQDEYSGYIAALDALEEKLAEQIAGEEVKG